MSSISAAVPAHEHASNRNLAHAISRGTLFGLFANGTFMLTRLITVPVTIHFVGLDGYGIWAIIMAFAAYMRLGTEGRKSAFQKYVAEATGTGDYERANQLLTTGTLGMFAITALILLPGALFAKRLAVLSGIPEKFLGATVLSIEFLAFALLAANTIGVYEAVLMGAHRVDLARKIKVVFLVFECVATCSVLFLGFGLFGMAVVLGSFEVARMVACSFAAARVMPRIRVRWKYATWNVWRELVRFTGSYQLMNVLEVLYVGILPIAVLKLFGATEAGTYALAARMVGVAMIAPESMVLPILSSGTLVFSSGTQDKVLLLVRKAFKITLGATLLPLAIVAAFGSTFVFAWTGKSGAFFHLGLWLVCAAALFRSVSLLSLVLYRATGGASSDLMSQIIRTAVLLGFVVFSGKFSVYFLMAGAATAEFIAMMLVLSGLLRKIAHFRLRILIPDIARLTAAILGVLAVTALVLQLPIPVVAGARLAAMVRLVEICATVLLIGWPMLTMTRFLSQEERRTLLGSLLPQRNAVPQAS